MAPTSAQDTKLTHLHSLDPVWEAVRKEAQAIIDAEPHMSGFIYGNILNQKTLEDAIIQRICQRLHQPEFSADMIIGMFRDMREDWPEWSEIVRVDIAAVYDRDPA